MADIVCPKCSTQYRISDSQLAKASKLRCQKCNTVFRLQDNIKSEEAPPPPPAPEPESAPSAEANTLEFDLSNIQFNYPETNSAPEEEEEGSAPPQGDFSLDMNLGEMNLDFGSQTEEDDSSATLAMPADFTFSQEDAQAQEEDIQDHINASFDSDSEEDSEFSEFSFAGGNDEPDLSEAPTLDFSFSAATPEASPEDDEEAWDDDEQGWDEEGEQPETMETGDSQDLGLDLGPVNFEEEEGPAEAADEEEEGEDSVEETPDEESYAEEYDEEPIEEELSNCCIDSLAMGLPRCELCGRNLEGHDQHYAQELQRLRREQLKEELIAGEAQISFSAEGAESKHEVPAAEDFSDVEQALDALADGTFHQKAKKREAKKNFAKTVKTIVTALVALGVLGGIAFIFLLPSSQEKLQARYEEFMAKGGENSKALAQLFLDSIAKKDESLFSQLTVMKTMPAYKSGEVISVGELDEEIPQGALGRLSAELEAEIAVLEQHVAEKTEELNMHSSENLSATLLEERIKQTKSKIAELTNEYEQKDAESSQKLQRLRKQLAETDSQIAEQRRISRKYIDATDQVGKALYENSISKQKYLNDQKVRLVKQIQDEEPRYQKRHQALDNEYQPQFTKLENRLATEQAQLKKANLLEDDTHSPVVILRKELDQLTQQILDKKAQLEESQGQLNEALNFFASQARQELTKRRQEAEFWSTTQYVAAQIKAERGGTQQISIVLKRYRAVLPDKTLQSNWLVEKSAE